MCNNDVYKSKQKFSFGLSNSENNGIKYMKNTARFRLIKTKETLNDISFIYKNLKIIISANYSYSNFSGTLETNTAFRGDIYANGGLEIFNKKINYLYDTKAIKCLNIDFELIDDKYIDLVIRYNQNLNNFDIFILSDDKPVENPVISYEDISKIQEWY